jgi:hypothetical protein
MISGVRDNAHIVLDQQDGCIFSEPAHEGNKGIDLPLGQALRGFIQNE